MDLKIISFSRLCHLCMATALVTGFAAASAQAGFEWNPPIRAANPQVMNNAVPDPSNAMGNVMAPSVESGPLTPMPGDTAPTARIEPVMEADIMDGGPKMTPVTTARPGMKSLNYAGIPQDLNAESDTMMPVSPVASSSHANVVEGFGKDIPLAIALNQVVPPVYTVSYQTGLDQGKPVTWNGGRVWTEVVNDMLVARKLHATFNGNTLMVAEGPGEALALPPIQPSAMADGGLVPMPVQGEPALKKPVIDLTQRSHWEAMPGQTLQQTLLSWSRQAKVELAWENLSDNPVDMPINSAFSYDGTFDQAVDALLSLYGGDKNEPHGKLYPNLPEGPSVLVVSVK